MKLGFLLKDIDALKISKCLASDHVSDLCSHSKSTQKGELFIDFKGDLIHCTEAIGNGAVAAITSCTSSHEKVISIRDFRENVLKIINKFYSNPLKDLKVIGITGTSGKTTTSFLIRHLLNSVGLSCGLISSVEVDTTARIEAAILTTPDLLSCYKYFHEMVKNSCKYCVMEVSSHGLDQNRTQGINFCSAIFTNLSHDHLDYHKSMDHYKACKKKLFTSLGKNSIALINTDDSLSSFMIEDTSARCHSYSIKKPSDYQAFDVHLSSFGSSFTLKENQKKIVFETNLIGAFNISNCLAAIGLCHKLGISLEELSDALKSFKNVPGRLEKVSNDCDIDVYVDFAHKPDALENVLKPLKNLCRARLITVIGCGGERDKQKRPLMASIAEKYSDVVILTSDNPRNEDPKVILQGMLKGLSESQKILCILSRKEAIQRAVDVASEKDTILIAGKGHETYQLVKGKKLTFDDRLIAKQFLQDKILKT